MDEIYQCIGSLLHAVHDPDLNEANAQTSLLQYCGLRMLQRATCDSPTEWSSYNDACWSVRRLVDRPAIRFALGDPINEPPRPIPFTTTVLLVPNNTDLNTSSTLVAQASQRHPCVGAEDSGVSAPIGSIVRTRTQCSDYYDEIWHLVCRMPGKPELVGLEAAVASIVPGEDVLCLRSPVFGTGDDWSGWATGLRRWNDARKNIQNSPVFLELCFISESLPVAEGIRAELSARGVPFEWPDHV